MPPISDHPFTLLIIEVSGSDKLNSLFNLISKQPYINKTHLYAKDPHETKYQFLFKKRENKDLKHLNYSKAFIEYSNDMNDIYKNIEECYRNIKRKILIVFVI